MRHRPVSDADLPALHAIYMSAEVNPFMGFDPVTPDGFTQIVAEWRRRGEFIVVEREGVIAAAYLLERRARRMAHAAYLGCLAVNPALHGAGVGSGVLAAILERLRDEGVLRVELLVASDNPGAIALFHKHGFAIEGTLRGYFRRAGSDALVDEHAMALLLSDARSSPAPAAPIARHRAQRYDWGEGCEGWHLVRSTGLSVIEERMPPGAAEVRHLHRIARQFFFVLRGQLSIEVEGERFTLDEREGLEIPPRCAHEVRNNADTDAEFLVVSQPPSHADRQTLPSE